MGDGIASGADELARHSINVSNSKGRNKNIEKSLIFIYFFMSMKFLFLFLIKFICLFVDNSAFEKKKVLSSINSSAN